MSNERQLAEVRFLTVAEVASIMRVSKMTVYRLVHGGDLPAVRVGRSFRVPEDAVHKYLQTSYIDTAGQQRLHAPEGATATTWSGRPFGVHAGRRSRCFWAGRPHALPCEPVRLVKFDLPFSEGCRRRSAPAQFEDTSHDKDKHGFCHQEAPQADGEEEAPQAAAQDAPPASQQEVT